MTDAPEAPIEAPFNLKERLRTTIRKTLADTCALTRKVRERRVAEAVLAVSREYLMPPDRCSDKENES